MIAGRAFISAHTNVLAYKQTVTLRGHVSCANATCVFLHILTNIVFSNKTTPRVWKHLGLLLKAHARGTSWGQQEAAPRFYNTPTLRTLGHWSFASLSSSASSNFENQEHIDLLPENSGFPALYQPEIEPSRAVCVVSMFWYVCSVCLCWDCKFRVKIRENWKRASFWIRGI